MTNDQILAELEDSKNGDLYPLYSKISNFHKKHNLAVGDIFTSCTNITEFNKALIMSTCAYYTIRAYKSSISLFETFPDALENTHYLKDIAIKLRKLPVEFFLGAYGGLIDGFEGGLKLQSQVNELIVQELDGIDFIINEAKIEMAAIIELHKTHYKQILFTPEVYHVGNHVGYYHSLYSYRTPTALKFVLERDRLFSKTFGSSLTISSAGEKKSWYIHL